MSRRPAAAAAAKAEDYRDQASGSLTSCMCRATIKTVYGRGFIRHIAILRTAAPGLLSALHWPPAWRSPAAPRSSPGYGAGDLHGRWLRHINVNRIQQCQREPAANRLVPLERKQCRTGRQLFPADRSVRWIAGARRSRCRNERCNPRPRSRCRRRRWSGRAGGLGGVAVRRPPVSGTSGGAEAWAEREGPTGCRRPTAAAVASGPHARTSGWRLGDMEGRQAGSSASAARRVVPLPAIIQRAARSWRGCGGRGGGRGGRRLGLRAMGCQRPALRNYCASLPGIAQAAPLERHSTPVAPAETPGLSVALPSSVDAGERIHHRLRITGSRFARYSWP